MVINWFLVVINWFLVVINRFLVVITTQGTYRAARAAKNGKDDPSWFWQVMSGKG